MLVVPLWIAWSKRLNWSACCQFGRLDLWCQLNTQSTPNQSCDKQFRSARTPLRAQTRYLSCLRTHAQIQSKRLAPSPRSQSLCRKWTCLQDQPFIHRGSYQRQRTSSWFLSRLFWTRPRQNSRACAVMWVYFLSRNWARMCWNLRALFWLRSLCSLWTWQVAGLSAILTFYFD